MTPDMQKNIDALKSKIPAMLALKAQIVDAINDLLPDLAAIKEKLSSESSEDQDKLRPLIDELSDTISKMSSTTH